MQSWLPATEGSEPQYSVLLQRMLILNVFAEPPVVHQQQFVEDLKVRIGDDMSLVCAARGHPMPHIKWLHNGHIVDKGISSIVRSSVADRSLLEEHKLSLQNVEITDAGKYTCLVSNVAGVAEKNYRLKVLGKRHYTVITCVVCGLCQSYVLRKMEV